MNVGQSHIYNLQKDLDSCMDVFLKMCQVPTLRCVQLGQHLNTLVGCDHCMPVPLPNRRCLWKLMLKAATPAAGEMVSTGRTGGNVTICSGSLAESLGLAWGTHVVGLLGPIACQNGQCNGWGVCDENCRLNSIQRAIDCLFLAKVSNVTV